ncbi:hypothetical protein [Paenibacillus sp. MBLB4367]|uniref:hypothetical protein n=1 Tax=Paenibacillus sp. MBLB4367 TaxID=3384767 RepID=UPI0039083437
MKLKLRLIPVIVTFTASCVILFGGWFVYNSMAMENPLTQLLADQPGVQGVQADLSAGQVTFDLQVNKQASLFDLMHRATTEGSKQIGKREVKLNVKSDSSEKLDKWWSEALFGVAQAMETKQYARIPELLNEKAANEGIQVDTQIDDKYVYIRLTEGEHSKFEMLPRNPAKMGVWPNE